MWRFVVLSGLVFAVLAANELQSPNARPIVIRNASADRIAVWLNADGCGIKPDLFMDGKMGKVLEPGDRIVAPDVAYFDSPTIKIFVIKDGKIINDHKKSTGYIFPGFGQHAWTWNGSALVKTDSYE